MSSRNTFAASRRSHTILKWLREGHSVRIEDVTDTFDIQYPQAREDLKLLEDLYELSTHREGRVKVWTWSEGDTEHIGVGTVAALELGAISLDIFQDTPYGDAIRELIEECRGRIPEPHHPRIERVSRALHLRRTWLPTDPDEILDYLEVILNAMWVGDHRWLMAEYEKSDGQRGDYLLLPRRLIWYQRRLWLLALDRDKLKLFDLAGFDSLERYRAAEHGAPHRENIAADGGEGLDEVDVHPVEYDDDELDEYLEQFDDEPDEYFENAFGIYAQNYAAESIHLEVDGHWRNYLDRYRIHQSQKNVPDEEGDTLHVHLQMGICPEFKSFVAGMIPDVRIHEPEGLREEIRSDVAEWLEDEPAQ